MTGIYIYIPVVALLLLNQPSASAFSDSLPHAFITLHVVDAIGDCLVETAEKWEQEAANKWKQLDTADAETAIARLLLEEFGRCADKLIAAAGISNR